MTHQLFDGDTPARVDLHQIMQQVDTLDAQPLGNGKTTRLDLAVDDGHIVGGIVERKTATKKGVEQNTHAPHIHLHTQADIHLERHARIQHMQNIRPNCVLQSQANNLNVFSLICHEQSTHCVCVQSVRNRLSTHTALQPMEWLKYKEKNSSLLVGFNFICRIIRNYVSTVTK